MKRHHCQYALVAALLLSALHLSAAVPLEVAQQAYLKASNPGARDTFSSVAVFGDTLVVGAYEEDSNATGVNGPQRNNSARNSGAAYVFVRSGTNWVQQAYLKASNTGLNDQFGVSVAVSEDTIVVGAWLESSSSTGVNGIGEDNNAFESGAAYVFVRSGTNWTQQAYLKASNTEAHDVFGWSVAVSGDTIAVGAPGESSNASGVNGNQDNNAALGSGAVYVFERTGTNWMQQAYLKASNAAASDEFGASVALSGATLVIGAYREDGGAAGVNGDANDNSLPDSGAAYVFVREGTNWSQQAYLKASNAHAYDHLFHVAISGDTVVAGAIWAEGTNSNTVVSNCGAAYIFVREGTNWTEQARLQASSPENGDHFGVSVATAGHMLVVGANTEDSAATGVNGDESSNRARDSGAAYIFIRRETNWSQEAYVKASNTGRNDLFGSRVAASGDTVVIGAPYESSGAAGVNKNQKNNRLSRSGAGYVFTVRQ